MTTSGSTTFNPTTYAILKRSLRMVGAYATTDEPRPEQLTDALEVMNMMLKSWQVDNFLWLRLPCTLFLNKGQTSYNLTDATGFSHCVTAYTQTTLAATAATGAGTLSLTSSAGMADGDYIGVASDNGVIEWFAATFAGNIATLSGVTTANASSGNVVYSHTTASQIKRPTRIFQANRKLYDSVAENGIEIPLMITGRDDYMILPNKTVQSKTTQVYYDPQLVTGILYVWPTADTPKDKIKMVIDRPIQDMLTDTDTYDVPQEWLDCICYGLAVRLAPEYGISISERGLLDAEYKSLREAVSSYDRENSASSIQRQYQ